MTEEKFKKTVVAVTVGAVLLVIVLVTVMIYQLIAINVADRRLDELNAEIEKYKLLRDDEEKIIEARSSYWWIVQRARELGYVFDGDKIADEN